MGALTSSVFRKSGKRDEQSELFARSESPRACERKRARSRDRDSEYDPVEDNTVSACIYAIACMQACIFDRVGAATMALQRQRVTHIAIYANSECKIQRASVLRTALIVSVCRCTGG